MKDSYSLPRIEHVLDQLLGSTILTTLDLKVGYWQVKMVEDGSLTLLSLVAHLAFMGQQMLQPHSRN